MAFEQIFDASNASPFKFEGVGAILEGYYMGSYDYTGDYGPTKKHVFNTKQGAVVVFGQRNLMQQLPSVTTGVMVRITYTGDLAPKAKGRAAMKLFKIEHDKDNTVSVAGVNLEKTEEPSYETVDEDGPGEQEEPLDVIQPAAPKAPARAVAPPQANQDRVRALLASRKQA